MAATLCYAISSCCAMCAVVRCAMPCFAKLCCACRVVHGRYGTAEHSTAWHMPCPAMPCYDMLCCAISCCCAVCAAVLCMLLCCVCHVVHGRYGTTEPITAWYIMVLPYAMPCHTISYHSIPHYAIHIYRSTGNWKALYIYIYIYMYIYVYI